MRLTANIINALLTRLLHRHEWMWPVRRADGKDWQTCSVCTAERLSEIQFTRCVRLDAPQRSESVGAVGVVAVEGR